MTIEEVLGYYGTPHAAEKKHSLAHQNFRNWKRLGYIPITTQMKIEKLTNGVLKARLEDAVKK